MTPSADSHIFVKYFSPLHGEFVGVSKIKSERTDQRNLVPQRISHETTWLIPREEVQKIMKWLERPLSDLDGLGRLISAKHDVEPEMTGEDVQRVIDEEYGGNANKFMRELFMSYDSKRGFSRAILRRQIDEAEYYDWISLWELNLVAKREKENV